MMKQNNYEKRHTHRIGVTPTNTGIKLTDGLWEVETTTTKLGSIVYSAEQKNIFDDLEEISKRDYIPEKIKKCSNKTANLVMILIMAISIPFLNFGLFAAAILMRVSILKNLLSILNECFQVKFGKRKSVGRFRKAAYVVLQRYNELGRLPKYEEIQNNSIYDKCEVNNTFRQIFGVIPTIIVISVAWNWRLYYVPLLFIALGLELIILKSKRNITKYCQVLITNKPKEMELRCAIEGLSIILQLCEKQGYDWDELPIQPYTVVVESVEISKKNLK